LVYPLDSRRVLQVGPAADVDAPDPIVIESESEIVVEVHEKTGL
jgi:hypothetical protein